jgi:hypothetical protein
MFARVKPIEAPTPRDASAGGNSPPITPVRPKSCAKIRSAVPAAAGALLTRWAARAPRDVQVTVDIDEVHERGWPTTQDVRNHRQSASLSCPLGPVLGGDAVAKHREFVGSDTPVGRRPALSVASTRLLLRHEEPEVRHCADDARSERVWVSRTKTPEIHGRRRQSDGAEETAGRRPSDKSASARAT